MDPDFTALASRVAARAEVLGCVILSRDGLVLGSFPPHGEQDITPGLLRFTALGDPDRGFAEFADELWAYVRQGAYAAFAVAEAGTRPGILLDYLEQALLVAEEARQFGVAMSEPVNVDLSNKGLNLGRRLRAAAPSVGDDFRASVVAPTHATDSGGIGHVEPPPRREVPAVEDRVLDEALAAATAAASGIDPEPATAEPAAGLEFEPAQASIGAPPEVHEEARPEWPREAGQDVVPQEVIHEVPREVIHEAPHEPPQEPPQDVFRPVAQEAPQDGFQQVPREAPQEIHQEAPPVAPQEPPQEVHREFPAEAVHEAPAGAHQQVPPEVHQEFAPQPVDESPPDVHEAVPPEVPEEQPQEVPQPVAREAVQEAPQPVAQEVHHETPHAVMEAAPPAPVEPAPSPEPGHDPTSEEPSQSPEKRNEEIDRIALAREFAQLLQEGPAPAESDQ
ncbi:MAG TPA: hypothetical protein VID47_01000 [Actinomycetota bacterium]